MSFDTQLSTTERRDLANELRERGWDAVAEDVEDGHTPETVINRLNDIGESDSDAAELIAGYIA